MLGRRNLRVKVMQVLYAWEIDRDTPEEKLETLLKNQIDRSVSLYITDLLYLAEICRYSMVDKAKRMAKFVKTEEDEKASTTIAANRIVTYLETDGQFNSYVKKDGIRHHVKEEIVKSLFNDLAAKERYKEYAALTTPDIDQDKDIVNFILKKVMPVNESLETHLEELFINYDDDNDLLLHILTKYVEAFDETKGNFFQSLDLWEEEKKFAHQLLQKTLEYDKELTEYIKPNLKNWEMERVAVLDLVLMKMALCEIKYFPTIPVKVSINEYIDISKMYSTPKSKDFVNGVLDKAKGQMMDKGEIKKFGRGLME